MESLRAPLYPWPPCQGKKRWRKWEIFHVINKVLHKDHRYLQGKGRVTRWWLKTAQRVQWRRYLQLSNIDVFFCSMVTHNGMNEKRQKTLLSGSRIKSALGDEQKGAILFSKYKKTWARYRYQMKIELTSRKADIWTFPTMCCSKHCVTHSRWCPNNMIHIWRFSSWGVISAVHVCCLCILH